MKWNMRMIQCFLSVNIWAEFMTYYFCLPVKSSFVLLWTSFLDLCFFLLRPSVLSLQNSVCTHLAYTNQTLKNNFISYDSSSFVASSWLKCIPWFVPKLKIEPNSFLISWHAIRSTGFDWYFNIGKHDVFIFVNTGL